MAQVHITKLNESFIKVTAQDESTVEDIYQSFKYKDPTHVPNKWQKWDGTVRMYDRSTGKMQAGVLFILLKWLKESEYDYHVDPELKDTLINKITREEIQEWVDGLDLSDEEGNSITPYDYQVESLFLTVKYQKMVLLAATSAGKSLIIYLIQRFYDMLYPEMRKIVVVPTAQLVTQLSKDFSDYSRRNGWAASAKVHQIVDGATKATTKPIIISTWQGIQNMDRDFFEEFAVLLVDECHGASAKKLTQICNYSTNAFVRIGLTGTLKDNELHPIAVQACFGPAKRVVTTKELIDAGRATKVYIRQIHLAYNHGDRMKVNGGGKDGAPMSFQEEVEFLFDHQWRNKVIVTLAKSLKGNSLFLFERVDSHLLLLEGLMKEAGLDVKVIHGDVKTGERDMIKALAESEDGVIILGTYGCISTGISIKRLRNLVFCHPSKSIVRVLQSIGRVLRLHKLKDFANLYDIIDDICTAGRLNYGVRHAIKRAEFYEAEGHEVTKRRIDAQ